MSILRPFSRACAELLSKPPPAGHGRHHWLFRVAAKLNAAKWKPEKIREGLLAVCHNQGWSDRSGKTIDDIMAKLGDLDPGDTAAREAYKIDWPEPNEELRRGLFHTPPMFDPDEGTDMAPTDILPDLYPGDPLICVGWDFNRFTTLPLSQLIDTAHTAPFIVANPMTAKRDSKGSARSQEIASPRYARRYLVVEFDTGDSREEQAAVLSALHSEEAPLIMAVWSGGKSIHGWYRVPGPGMALCLFRIAVRLGADESLFDMSKLVRMPGGTRHDGAHQTVLYYGGAH